MAKMLVGKESDIPPGTMKQYDLPGMDAVLVANIDGKYYAMRALCNHMGGPVGEGVLEGSVATCPWHGAKWNVTTGKLAEFDSELDDEKTYATTVEDGDIYIET
jgi:nitrite reductase/ring-hydroxylating ferredoxin subunit